MRNDHVCSRNCCPFESLVLPGRPEIRFKVGSNQPPLSSIGSSWRGSFQGSVSGGKLLSPGPQDVPHENLERAEVRVVGDLRDLKLEQVSIWNQDGAIQLAPLKPHGEEVAVFIDCLQFPSVAAVQAPSVPSSLLPHT